MKYEWSLPDGTTVSITSPTLAVTDIVTTAFAAGSYTFGLTVTDDSGNESTPTEVTVVFVDTQAPTAVVDAIDARGLPLVGSVRVGSVFSLRGSRSVDIGGRIVRYEWSLPDGTTLVSSTPTFAVTEILTTRFGVGQHTFGLRVTDDSGNESSLARVTVTIVS